MVWDLPPRIAANSPLALFREPPLTDEARPLAVFWLPPLTEAILPLAVFWLPPLTRGDTAGRGVPVPTAHCGQPPPGLVLVTAEDRSCRSVLDFVGYSPPAWLSPTAS